MWLVPLLIVILMRGSFLSTEWRGLASNCDLRIFAGRGFEKEKKRGQNSENIPGAHGRTK